MDKLEIINYSLEMAGFPPVASPDETLESIEVARVLEAERIKMLTEGHYFNTVVTTIVPDVDQRINLPMDAITAVPTNPRVNAVKRGRRMYNLDTVSFIFTEPIEVQIQQDIAYDDLDVLAQEYLKHTVCLEFYTKSGYKDLYGVLFNNVQFASQSFNIKDSEKANFNMFRDNLEVSAKIRRV